MGIPALRIFAIIPARPNPPAPTLLIAPVLTLPAVVLPASTAIHQTTGTTLVRPNGFQPATARKKNRKSGNTAIIPAPALPAFIQ